MPTKRNTGKFQKKYRQKQNKKTGEQAPRLTSQMLLLHAADTYSV